MKIMQINCVFDKGSTGRIVRDIHTELLSQGIESVVCYGRGVRTDEENIHKICGELYSKFNNFLTRFTGLMYGGCWISTRRLISMVKKEKPDVVHLQCINGYFINIYRLVTWLKKNHIKTVLTLHAEFMYTANCGHALECERWKIGCGDCPRCRKETKSLFLDQTARSWEYMKKAFEGFEDDCTVVSVSPWLMERAQQAPIFEKFRHKTILNGIDNEVFQPRDGAELRERFGLSDKKVVLHVTAGFSMKADHLKGGWYVVQLAKQMPEVSFVVIGSREMVENLPENVLNIGRVHDPIELAKWYSTADVTLLTSKRETFSMVTAESLCCGTPVVGFRAGAPEMIAISDYSDFVPFGDQEALKAAVQKRLLMGKNGNATSAQLKYSSRKMGMEYIEEYKKLKS